jgi:hypothetical protein
MANTAAARVDTQGTPKGQSAGAGPPRIRRRMRNLLLDRMQLRYTAVIVVVTGALVSGFGALIYNGAREASQLVQIRAMDPSDELAQQLVNEFAARDKLTLAALVGLGLVLVVAMFVFGLFITHKVAGPIYKLSLYTTKIRDNNLTPIYALRRGDQLQEFYDAFKQMHDALRQRAQDEAATLGKIIAALESMNPDAELTRRIEELRTIKLRKERSLEAATQTGPMARADTKRPV